MSCGSETARSALWRTGNRHDFIHNTVFRGRMLRRGPAPEPQRAFKVELGRINCVKYSDDNNPRFSTCAGGESHGGSWLNGVVHQRNIREIEPRVGWRRCAAPHSSDGTICLLCFNLSTHYLLQFGGLTWGHSSLGRSHAKYSGTTVICGNPRVTGTHVKKRMRAYKVTASQWSFLKLQRPPQRGRCLISTHCLCLLKIKGLHGYLYKYVISGPAFSPSTTINKAATDLNHNHQQPAWTGKHPQQ